MKRKKKPEEPLDERWMLPYSDMMTLSLSLFIVMFGVARVDEAKFGEMRDHFGILFSSNSGGDSIIENVVDLGGHQVILVDDTENEGNTEGLLTVSSEQMKESQVEQKIEEQQLIEARENMLEAFAALELAEDVQISLQSDGIYISLEDSLLFATGSADLPTSVEHYLDIVSNEVKHLNKEIVVAGHTDNVPVVRSNYSNWELSANRAIAVMNYLVLKEGIDQKKVSIQAFADTQPAATNQTSEGRSKNRRVEIIVYKDHG